MEAEVKEVQPKTRQSLVVKFAEKYSIEPAKLMSTLKATAFRQAEREATNEEMAALLVVADQYGLNPFTRELFAFCDKNRGIVPVVSVDGWARIINDHKAFDGVEFEYGYKEDGQIDYIIAIIYRKDRTHPFRVPEFFEECRRDTGPWRSHPRRMLRHKALIQCARIAFGFSGIYDEDEAARIIETGGGIPVATDGGEVMVGDAQPAARTDGLAAELAARAKAAEDAAVIPAADDVKPSEETVRLAIEGALNQDDLQKALHAIMKLPANDARTAIMKAWNAKVRELHGAAPAKAEAEEARGEAEASNKQMELPTDTPEEKPAASVPQRKVGTKRAAADVKKQMSEAKNLDQLDEITDAANSMYEWSRELVGELNTAYHANVKRLEGAA